MMDILSKVEDEVSARCLPDGFKARRYEPHTSKPPLLPRPRRATRKSCSRRQMPFQAPGQLGGILGARSAMSWPAALLSHPEKGAKKNSLASRCQERKGTGYVSKDKLQKRPG